VELPDDADAEKVAGLVEQWAESCIAERHVEVAEL
jgi:hypothetical protein